jgi:hypothetical protein
MEESKMDKEYEVDPSPKKGKITVGIDLGT